MYDKLINLNEESVNLSVGKNESTIYMYIEDHWVNTAEVELSVEDAKRLRNYLTEAINFATLNEEDTK